MANSRKNTARRAPATDKSVSKADPVVSAAEIKAAQSAVGSSLKLAGVNTKAKDLGESISKDTLAEFERLCATDEYSKVIGLLLADHIGNDYTAEEILSMPRCLLRKDCEEFHAKYKGNPPNVGFDWLPVKDGKKTKWTSFFDTMLEATPFIRDLRKQVEEMDDVIQDRVGQRASLKAAFKNEADQKAEKERLAKRITNVQGKWRLAWRTVQNEARLDLLFPDHINYVVQRDNNGNVRQMPKPIFFEKMQEKGVKGAWTNMSVSQFAGLDLDLAHSKREADTPSGSYDAIIATMSRDEEEVEKVDADNINVTNEKQFETAIASILSLLHDKPAFVTALVKKVNGIALVDAAPLAKTLGDIAVEFNIIKSNIQKRYEDACALEAIASGNNAGGDPKVAERALTGT